MNRYLKNELAKQGYNTIALPKEDIHPLLLLYREKGYLKSLGAPLQVLFEPDEAPLVLPQTGVANLQGNDAFEFDAGLGLDFLSAVFKLMKLNQSTLQANLGGNRAVGLSFKFEDVREEKVGELDLDNFLSGAIPLEGEFRTFGEKLKDSELYVITEVLRSNGFTIQLAKGGNGGFNLGTAVEKLAEGNTKIKRNSAESLTISQEDADLAFAFKAVKILYDQKAWWQFWKKKDAGFRIRNQEGQVMRSVEDFPVDYLKAEEVAVDI